MTPTPTTTTDLTRQHRTSHTRSDPPAPNQPYQHQTTTMKHRCRTEKQSTNHATQDRKRKRKEGQHTTTTAGEEKNNYRRRTEMARRTEFLLIAPPTLTSLHFEEKRLDFEGRG
ncbi:hypothetical protein QL285_005393 [Trifolium repens]|nr:hypothetical protein QL285_046781 [Trifolium repens]KAK2423505.1 hypothetical protein QL285_033955 [Trifolium repens]KAK2458207.1 hypothetical protein QL285_005393 [Trifolium repens]